VPFPQKITPHTPSFCHFLATLQGLTYDERVEILAQTSVELAQASVNDWSFIAVTRYHSSPPLAEC
jgi:hypothetical protein